LVPRLLEAGNQVVCLARTPAKLDDRPWRDRVEVRRCDVLAKEDVVDALLGCDVAYYLIHSMGDQADFADADRVAAENFANGAAANHLQRLVYLGGLGRGEDLSPHLASRQEVGRTLAAGPTPVTELRASVVIGAGSVSFEMLRYLTEVLPVMVTPRWVETRTQPIAIRDVLAYLVAVLDDDAGSVIYEIGGPDVVTYREMMQTYARVAGLPKRLIIPVPVLSPRLSSLWIGLVTPLPSGVARPLVDSLRNEVVVEDQSANKFGVATTPLDGAIRRAMEHDHRLEVPSRWSDASTSPARPFPSDPEWAGGSLLEDRQTVATEADPADLFWAFTRVGGEVGYYGFPLAWGLRGLLDTLVGGVGLRRGRRHPQEVRLHDTIDFWRVSSVERNDHLQLAAEMKLPGEAWLEWRIRSEDGSTHLDQIARFRPRGLFGRLYWYAMYPFHRLIFGRMANRIVAAAETHSTG
jgi:uncharacterized protein YbjT (DUF2867 family)